MTVRIYQMIIIVLSVMLFSVWQVYAGNPAGPGTSPDATSSYTLNDIYARLDAGAAGSESTFTEPSVAPGTGTTHTLNEIMGAAPTVDDSDGATAANVVSGKTFWGLTTSGWGLQTGTADLSAGGGAGVPKTGQTTCYDAAGGTISCAGTGQDGDLQMGVAWPNPRFTDNGDGTVTDNFTGLIWLKNANCASTSRIWASALSDVTQLNTDGTMNSNNCGDTSKEGSNQTDWRLPNVRELHSLIDYGEFNPALPQGHPFTSVQSYFYWSSSVYAGNTTNGWYVTLGNGYVGRDVKSNNYYVWPVRGGQ